MTRIDGKEVSAALRAETAREVKSFSERTGRAPKLTVIRVGEDPASVVYVRNKQRACDEVGIHSEVVILPEDTTEDLLLAKVEQYNADPGCDGILVQLPLPAGLSERRIIRAIAPEKDVDCFSPVNAGLLFNLGEAVFLPCTPAGVMELLKYYRIDPAGKRAVVVGRSNIVGKPMALLLLAADATVTLCHSRTKNLAAVTREADILVSAVGRARMITPDMVKPGAVVIDVGMNRDGNGKLCGDVDFDAVAPVASYLTPVPGGVGPMTVTMLLRNTLRAAEASERAKIIKTEKE